MKKLTAITLSVLLAFCFSANAAAVTAPASPYLYGDVNFDGKINIRDSTRIQKGLAMPDETDEFEKLIGDYNHDGETSVKDATDIQRKLADFPVSEKFGGNLTWFLDINSFTNTHNLGKAKVGDTVTFDCDIAASHSPLSFKLFVNKKPVTESENSKLTYTFESAGQYTILYCVYDSLGMECPMTFGYTVTEPDSKPYITSINMATIDFDSETVEFSVDAQGGSGDYMYQFSLFNSGDPDQNTVLYQSKYTSDSVIKLPADTLQYAGSYRLIVTVRDKDGNTSEAEAFPFVYEESA